MPTADIDYVTRYAHARGAQGRVDEMSYSAVKIFFYCDAIYSAVQGGWIITYTVNVAVCLLLLNIKICPLQFRVEVFASLQGSP